MREHGALVSLWIVDVPKDLPVARGYFYNGIRVRGEQTAQSDAVMAPQHFIEPLCRQQQWVAANPAADRHDDPAAADLESPDEFRYEA
jgi:hypothetical protein